MRNLKTVIFIALEPFEVVIRMAIEQIKMYVCITMHGCKNTKSFGNSKEKYRKIWK